MDYQKEIMKLLNDLKKKNHSRRRIEKNLGYADKYLDQILSRGGNESVYIKLKEYKSSVDNGHIPNLILSDQEEKYLSKSKHFNAERALIDMLILEMAKMKSKLYGVSVEDAIFELEQNARIALRQIEKNGS